MWARQQEADKLEAELEEVVAEPVAGAAPSLLPIN
jgi:hypothetical protein